MRERGIGVVSLMLVSSTITALVLGPLALLADAAWMPSTGQGWAILVGLAWISHTAGQGLIAYAFAHLRPAFSALVLLLQPVLAALFAWEILGEAMQPGQLVGAGFVILGIALAQRAAPTRR
jgi:drug/metabolite transporter (DMT)-like permease